MSETSVRSGPIGAQSVSERVAQQGSDVQGRGREHLRDQFAQRTIQVGQQVRTFADTLRRTGWEIENQSGGENVSRVAAGVADRLERVGGYLEEARGDDVLRDAERVARERPWLVAGTAAAVGFTLSRLLKASSESRYESNGSRSIQRPNQGGNPTLVEPANLAPGAQV